MRDKKRTIMFFCVAIVGVIAILLFFFDKAKQLKQNDETNEAFAQINVLDDVSINLGNGIYITAIGKYTGMYVEDGSDEHVSDVLMMTVENRGKESVQYAEIVMPVGDKEAYFKMSTLIPGSKMILLEQNRMKYEEEKYTTAIAQNVVVFSETLNLCEDILELEILDGIINVSNISGKDVNGDIIIYYKNCAGDVFYGGITYRARIEGGLKKDEIKQIMASHCSETGSNIMFVACGEN